MLSSLRASLALMSRRERFTYFLLIASKVLSSFLDLAGIAVIGLLVGLGSASLSHGNSFSIAGMTFPAPTPETFAALAIFVLVLFGGKGVLAILLSRTLSRFLASLDLQNARRIADSFLNGDLAYFQTYSREKMNWAILESTTIAFSSTLLNFATVVSESALLLLIGTMFVIINPLATVFTLAYFAILIFLMEAIVGRINTRAGRTYARGVQATSGAISDIQNTFREISVFQRQTYFSNQVLAARADVANGVATMKLLQTMPRYIVETALMVGVVGFLGWQFLSGGLQDGAALIGIFLAGGVRMMGSALPLQNSLASLKNFRGQSDVAQELLAKIAHSAKNADDEDAPVLGLVPAAALGVLLEDVVFCYPESANPTLRGISLVVEPGQHVAIIGPSGAGKTTLVDLILGLLPQDSGQVTISGMSPALINRTHPGIISYVPQTPGIVAGTIAENIALGVAPEDIDYDRIAEVVSLAFLDDFIAGIPDGVYSPLGAQLSALSGGQIQRLGLARALYTRPRLLILDEATSALDAGSESVISRTLRDLGREVTVIVVAHRLSTVQHSDNVFVIESGELVASGTFSQLRKTVPLIEEYVSLMSFDDQK